jgi:hypothetical protein
MKTIYTSLPIYNKYQKQCFERGKHAGFDTPNPIVCPRHRLPSFQWLDESDGAASVTRVDLMVIPGHSSQDITTWFTLPTMIPLAHDYFTYSGNTLNKLLTVGTWFLLITMDNGKEYFSDWFTVDCVFENLITSMTNNVYEHFTSATGVITVAIEEGADGSAYSNSFTVSKGESLTVVFFLTLNSGQLPSVSLVKPGVGTYSNIVATAAGLNVITLIPTISDSLVLWISNNGAADFTTSQISLTRNYSDKYLIMNFHNDCDLGDIYYHGGFTQTLWFKSEPMESVFPLEESGITNGEGQVVRTFARQTKKYIVRTDKMPDYMVDVFNRMRLHDTVTLTDLVGDTNTIYNLEVEHEWLAPDKYYAQINLTFDYDETVVIGGCCNNLT